MPSHSGPSPEPGYGSLGGGMLKSQFASNHQYVSPRAIQLASPAQRNDTSSGVVWNADPLFAGYGWSLK